MQWADEHGDLGRICNLTETHPFPPMINYLPSFPAGGAQESSLIDDQKTQKLKTQPRPAPLPNVAIHPALGAGRGRQTALRLRG